MRPLGDVLYNFRWIEPGKGARASRAYGGFLGSFLERHEIGVMINVRGPEPNWRGWRKEKRVCTELGIEHRDVMLSAQRLPTRNMLLTLLDAIDEGPGPVLLKCSGGRNRANFASALYIVHRQGWDAFKTAQRQFPRWPFLRGLPGRQRWLKLFLVFARADAKGRPLREWITFAYDPLRFKSWLEAHGEADSFHELYDPALGL